MLAARPISLAYQLLAVLIKGNRNQEAKKKKKIAAVFEQPGVLRAALLRVAAGEGEKQSREEVVLSTA